MYARIDLLALALEACIATNGVWLETLASPVSS